MTDKELLELAAKAAGINLQWESDGTMQNRMNRPTIPYECHGMISATDWNPLTDDGDALRLAVKLGLQVTSRFGYADAVIPHPRGDSGYVEAGKGDPYAATRRVIVRAAAALGKLKTPNAKVTGSPALSASPVERRVSPRETYTKKGLK